MDFPHTWQNFLTCLDRSREAIERSRKLLSQPIFPFDPAQNSPGMAGAVDQSEVSRSIERSRPAADTGQRRR